LLAGLNLAVNPELLAEEAAEGEPESSEEPTQDPPEEAPTESLPPTDASDWEADLDARIEEAQERALENREDRAADVGPESQEAEDPVEPSSLSRSKKGTKRGKRAAILFGTSAGLIGGFLGPAVVCIEAVPGYEHVGACIVVAAVFSPFGAMAGGYLGHRIWRSLKSDGEQYSLLPYWDEERSGVMLSGRF